jgi:hypothetical protein
MYEKSKEQIREKIAKIDEEDTETAESVKYWVCEDESDEIDLPYFSETRSPSSDIAKAISKLLNKRSSISKQDIAGSPRVSCKLVRQTLSKVFTMKKFTLRLALRPPMVASKHENVPDSRIMLKWLKANSANEFTMNITIDESWYYQYSDCSS